MEHADKQTFATPLFLTTQFMRQEEIMPPERFPKNRDIKKSACVKCQFRIRAKVNVVNGHFTKRKM